MLLLIFIGTIIQFEHLVLTFTRCLRFLTRCYSSEAGVIGILVFAFHIFTFPFLFHRKYLTKTVSRLMTRWGMLI